jgi:hypothetical protein
MTGARFLGGASRMVCVSLVSLALAPGGAAAQPSRYLGCVTPRATVEGPTFKLRRTWISVFTKPSTKATTMSYSTASPFPLWIVGESGSFYRVATGSSMGGWPFKPQTILGWVRKPDVEDQGIRNCT